MLRYNCQISRELWEERYERELAKMQAEFDEALKSPYRYAFKSCIEDAIPDLYRRTWKQMKIGFGDLRQWDFNGIKDVFFGMIGAMIIPFIFLYALVAAPKVVRNFLEPPLNEFKDVSYPECFKGVWDDENKTEEGEV